MRLIIPIIALFCFNIPVFHAKAQGPIAVDDAGSTTQSTPLTINALANDAAISPNILLPATLDLDPESAGIQSQLNSTSGDFIANTATGAVTYSPADGFWGNAIVTYTVNDDQSATSNTATIAIYVNRKPIATSDAATTAEDEPVTIAVLSNDVDEEGSLQPGSVDLNPATPERDTEVQAVGGVFTVDGSGIVSFSPEADFDQVAAIHYSVKDALGQTSNDAEISVTVTPVNDRPAITGYQEGISTLEDTPISLVASHFTIDDPDDASFTITAVSGTNYTAAGNVITPAPDFSGTINVSVTVNDGDVDSDPIIVPVAVTAVNDKPEITGYQIGISTLEDTPITVVASHLTIDDPDDVSFTIIATSGTNYTALGNVITPDPDFSGTINVSVTVNDGDVDSDPLIVPVAVTAVNDKPEITGYQIGISTLEDTPITLVASHLTVDDPDDVSFTITAVSGTNYSAAGDVITPDPDFSGTINVSVTVNDGDIDSDPLIVPIAVTAVNDKPEITDYQIGISTLEDTPIALDPSHFTISDPDHSVFTVIASSGTNYTALNNVITPAENFSGPLDVTVLVSDGTDESAPVIIPIDVTAVNDAPVISAQAIALNTDEDHPITLQPSNVTFSDIDNTSGFTITAADGANYSVSNDNIVVPDPHYSGPLTVSVRVNDGASFSNSFDININVDAVNDAPVISAQAIALSTDEDKAITVLISHVTFTDVDNTTGFTLTAGTGDNYSLSGNIITPNANYSGPLSVPVTVSDGPATSNVFNVQIQVDAVNDAPVITTQAAALATGEDNDIVLQPSHVIFTDVDNTTGFTISATAGANYSVSGATVTPDPDYFGPLSVPVTISDGPAQSNSFSLQIQVNAVNDAPVITAQAIALNTDEDHPITLQPSSVTFSDIDNTSGFTITATDGANYSVSNDNIVVPDSHYSGPLAVSVRVNDGASFSNSFDININVDAVNDAPVISAQAIALSTDEDNAITVLISHVTFTDVDNNTGFTLTAGTGDNYSLSGNIITPNANYSGPLSVPVTVSDGPATSNVFIVQIQVTAVNDAPVISGQANALATDEDNGIVLLPSHVTFTDVDNTTGFTISATDGANYSVSGTTVTPDPDYVGPLTVPVRISDGTANSNIHNVQIQVNAVNDAPIIIGQQSTLNTAEEQSIILQIAQLNISDPDDSEFALTVSDGSGYSVSGNTVTPDQDVNGTLSVQVHVSDGDVDSAPFNVSIDINPVNDRPVITAQQPLTVSEDTPLTVALSHITVLDPDNTGFELSVYTGANYTLSGKTITPALNYHGPLEVLITVDDGLSLSEPFFLDISVTPVNDIPVISGQSPVSISEETPVTLLPSHLTFSDPDNDTEYTVIPSAGAGYTFSGSTITPDPDVTGLLVVEVRLNDGTGNSAPFDLEVQVDAQNDAPVISAQLAKSIQEDAEITLQLSDLTFTDADNATGFFLVISDGANYALSGNTVQPDPDYNGPLTVPVSVHDGTDSSNPFSFQIQVTAVNDAPIITGPASLSTPEETNITIQASDLDISDPDNTSGFILTVFPGSNYTLTGSTITPDADFNGTLEVLVRVNDGNTNSNDFPLEVDVSPVNDAPVITGQIPLGTGENTLYTLLVSDLVISDPDNTSFSIIISSGANYTFSGNTITPAQNYNGPLTIPVQVDDGTVTSNSFNVNLLVSSVNNEPEITGQVSLSTAEDEAITLAFSDLTVTDPDNTYPSGFLLIIQTGDNYSVNGQTVTPDPDFNGTLTVPIQVNDGTTNSQVFGLHITVDPVNDAPAITGQNPVTTPEDQAVTIALTDLIVADPDNDSYPSGFSLEVLPGTGYTLNGNAITPSHNFAGTLSVPVRVHDGELNSATFDIDVTVTPVNDAPVITGQIPVTIQEDQSVTLQVLHLAVTDVDNSFPTGFSLDVSPGADYTVSGNTITPAPNFNGPLEVQVRVNDGTVNSAVFNLAIDVTAVNDRPVISGNNPISTPEEQAVTILPGHLSITDPDDTYPGDFTLTVGDGTNFTRSLNTITPAANFNGTLNVPVRVNDGTIDSEVFNLQVQVSPVNDAPVITGHTFISTNEDQPVTIQLSQLTVTDIDNAYPTGFSLTILPGNDYTFSGNTLTPAEDFTGELTVKVRVNDGAANSNEFDIAVQVNDANDIPVISGHDVVATNEEQPFTIALSHLTVTDPDNTYPDDFSISVLSGTNYTASGNTVTPALNLNGSITVRVLVNDGQANSNTFNLQLQVNAVNDAPVITGQTAVSFAEDAAGTIQLSHLVVSDPDNAYPDDFTLSVSNGTNYTRTGNTITPAQDFTGTLTVPVTVNDGDVSSQSFNMQVQISGANDAPSITGQSALTTMEDTPITLEVSNLTILDPDNTSGFTITVSAGDHYTFSENVITPVTNFNGTLTVPVTVSDGTNISEPFGLEIQVNAVNDVAVITAQSPVSTPEDTPVTLNVSQLTFADVDNTSGFSLVVSAGPNYTVAGNIIDPATNFNGALKVPVRINDGTANSGVFEMTVQVGAVNDIPAITGQNAVSTNEEQSVTVQLAHLTVSDPDDTYPQDFTVTALAGTNYTVTNNSVKPADDFNGTLSVPVRVNDGSANSNTFQLKITVNAVNDAPVISGQNPVSTDEDQPVTIQLSDLTVADPDDTYPQDFSLTVLSGTNYTFTGNSVKPATHFNGALIVKVRVHDGAANSNVFDMNVTVNAVNDAPVISGQVSLNSDEDKSIAIQLSHLTITDPDSSPAAFSLTVLSGSNYTASGNTVTPSANFTGILTVKARVSDGAANSNIFDLKVQVNPINDAPIITGQPTVNTAEETALTVQLSHLTIADPDNASGFTLTVLNGTGYTRSGNAITPEENFNGTLTVPVRVSDGSLNSNNFDLKVQVTAVNDAPVIIGQKILSTEEDIALTLQVSDLTIQDPDNASGFTLEIQNGEHYTSSGNTITPGLDFNGTINVNIRARDAALAYSPDFVVQIQVGDANDPPVITAQVALSVDEDATLPLTLHHFTVTDPDNSYPGDFTLHIVDGANYTVSGNTVISDQHYYGSLTVPVNVNDGVNNSALFNAMVTVKPVNDLPSFDQIENQQIPENSGEHFVTVQNISRGPLEDAQFLVFIATSSNTNILEDPIIIFDGTSANAELRYTVKPNVSGLVTVTVRAVDNGDPSGTYISTFQVEVLEINAAPTLNAISDISFPEDSPMQEIPLTGITAGPGENQPLTVAVSTDNPDLFESQPVVVYQSPGATGVLQLTPRANAFGTTIVSVMVTDNGSNSAPNVNNVTHTFTFTVEPVNDAPAIESTPGTVAVANELYVYDISVADIENEDITFTFPAKPEWLNFTAGASNKGKLSGNPVVGGSEVITVVATDASGAAVSQTYTLDINTRPVLNSASISAPEDQSFKFPVTSVFFDADGDAMAELKITGLPQSGTLKSGNDALKANVSVPASSFGNLVYEPGLNYSGKDTVRLIASDGRNYSLAETFIAIEIKPVNDAPVVSYIEPDTLSFEVNGEPDFITAEFEASDPDDPHLTGADIAFTRLTYKRDDDVLLFENTSAITGNFDAAAGVLVLTGEASAEDYVQAIRSVQYNHLRTVDPVLEPKTITFTLTDGKALSIPENRTIMLTYTFTDLKIPSAFTPNGDHINETWFIAPPGGELINAVIKVFNHRGIVVYESTGFVNPWDGTYNGELLPPGTYFYTIDLKLENQKTYKGTVTMLH